MRKLTLLGRSNIEVVASENAISHFFFANCEELCIFARHIGQTTGAVGFSKGCQNVYGEKCSVQSHLINGYYVELVGQCNAVDDNTTHQISRSLYPKML
ncbi:hypothetical protein AVEN_202561-1 [Araneus ventricosus]|uniref:Uncharacterized protein n=1 Tax=Araneus ventricosus TaxID=182803 RepID=A0A4Y2JTB5_ARAVE|nr:hypothetical protein AVEN_202561-1 [Araneus ventricosus]